MTFARKMPEFYVTIAQKYFPEFTGDVPPATVSNAYGDGYAGRHHT